jgi:hypothetical protein
VKAVFLADRLRRDVVLLVLSLAVMLHLLALAPGV